MLLLDATAPWLAVFGRAHPILLHAPLGMLPAIAVLEFGAAMLRRPVPYGPVLALAWLCALSAAAATASGLVLAGEPGYGGETLSRHKLAGIVLGILCVLAACCAFWRRRAPFRVVLLLALVAMVPAGHLGGTLTHGADFLFAPLRAPRVIDLPATASEYERVIRPLLERTCTSCHNEDKQKGDLLLTTPAGIQQGGFTGPVVVPGKPEESPLLTRCLLPLDHDDHMPPEGKPQPTEEELAALRAWIAAGAPF